MLCLPAARSCFVAVIAVAVVVVVAAGCNGVALSGVAPGEVAAGGRVVLDGAGFDSTLAASLSGGGVDVALAVVVEGVDRAVATLPASTPQGTYDVTVSTSSGTATLAGALSVVAGRLEVVFVDVGQGDATFLVFPDQRTLLLDGGPRDAAGAVRDVIDQHGGVVDAVAVSHTDADHLGGVVGVLRGADDDAGTADDLVPATRWIGHDDDLCTSQLCDEFRALRSAPFEIPDAEAVVDHGGATVRVVARDGVVDGQVVGGVDEENERSLALLVEFGGKSVFLGGDLTGGGLGSADVEAAVAAVTGPVDVLRLNHHGSQTSSSQGFLDALQPRAVVVSVGTDNAFCHPEASVVSRLGQSGARVFATGDGVKFDVDRCDGAPTAWPAGSAHGIGTFSLVIDADGTMTLGGEVL